MLNKLNVNDLMNTGDSSLHSDWHMTRYKSRNINERVHHEWRQSCSCNWGSFGLNHNLCAFWRLLDLLTFSKRLSKSTFWLVCAIVDTLNLNDSRTISSYLSRAYSCEAVWTNRLTVSFILFITYFVDFSAGLKTTELALKTSMLVSWFFNLK